jgi:hypothetical protein
MPQNGRKHWEDSDYTSEDLIFSSAGSWRGYFEKKFEANRSIIPQPDLHTKYSSTASWFTNDYTPKEASPADRFTLFIREVFSSLVKKREEEYSINLNEDISSIVEESLEKRKIQTGKKTNKSLLLEIFNVFKECAEENWDGCDAKPISIKSCLMAMKLAESLPEDIPRPDVIPEPSGEIAFEWYRGKGYVFILSVSNENKVSYAGLFGTKSKSFGSEYFYKELPSSIISKIRRLYA